jgi:hypothetical protein
MDFDRARSLDELEGVAWGQSEYDSALVLTCHRLRQKPLLQFTVEDLRVMIGQDIGLPFLIPLAIEELEKDPFACGDFYPGDLLNAVLRIQSVFWEDHVQLSKRLYELVQRLKFDSDGPMAKDLEGSAAEFLSAKPI